MTLNTKYDIINWFGNHYNYSSYLEISVLTTGGFFNKVNDLIFKRKECLNYYVKELDDLYADPQRGMPLDHDFKTQPFGYGFDKLAKRSEKFDVILVDSFHTVEYTMRDLEASIRLISPKGVIVVHDCYPENQSLIGPWKQGSWCGQTYEGYVRFIAAHSEYENYVFDVDYGCGIIRPWKHNKEDLLSELDLSRLSDWFYYWSNSEQLLNLKSIASFESIYSEVE
jgi:hypothetical protein